MISNFLFVAFGGSVGAMMRYAISLMSLHFWGDSFPWGTFVANCLGCLVMGFLVGAGIQKDFETSWLLVGVGILGALTTFSTFSAETIQMALDGFWIRCTLNVLGNVFASLGACFLGVIISRLLSGA